jgi:hypothetical protein
VTENGRYTVGRFRRRAYPRRFDWKLARDLHERGLNFNQIAAALGVDRRSVARVCRLPESKVPEATKEQIAALVYGAKPEEVCPRCFNRKSATSEFCRQCRQEMRLDKPTTLRRVAGTHGRNRIELRAVGVNRIVEVDGEYGVLVKSRNGPTPDGYRVVDFWDGGPTLVHERIRVAVLPSTEVLVGGVNEGGEEIDE